MVLVSHKLSDIGRNYAKKALSATVTFFRCTGMTETTIVDKNGNRYIDRHQCTFMRPNKYQKRQPGERHK
jgi:hypothetical protein